ELLSRWPATSVTAVLDEAVLRRCIGGETVLRRQLKHLLDLGGLRNTTLQVLPLTCSQHSGFEGPFILLTPQGKPQMGYVEVQGVSRLITEAESVRILAARYGNIRGQALTSDESLALIEKLLEEG